MICNKIVDESHFIDKNNKYLVDTNILIYLYGDPMLKTESEKLKRLSITFNNALNIGCTVYVPAIVISEFINRYHRLEFERIKQLKGNKKLQYKRDYRDTEKYKQNNEFIIKTIKESILTRCTMIEDKFVDEYKNKIFDINEGQDFNDVIIINIANKNNCYLISADIDAKKIEIR